ncbi:hypothetical protein ACPOL_4242 [Acidisarcina polymorpha]|uniref:Uncharacterized protein n=1 Tax=Acidisarcina polymorpha TaxID=2211140 RepID=A0A2Z5G468_9BACT|nr:hypothetical protein ACPOL_4242 [Acidisarcina polymorpha]
MLILLATGRWVTASLPLCKLISALASQSCRRLRELGQME